MKRAKKLDQVQWPPPPAAVNRAEKDGFVTRQNGEPTPIDLGRWSNDKALSGHHIDRCCDCGLTHLLTYSVVRDGEKWSLIQRAYRL